jgi:hypothetical protein
MALKKLARLTFYIVIVDLYIITYAYDTHLFEIGKYERIGFPFDNSFGRFFFHYPIFFYLQVIFYKVYYKRRAKFLTYINMVNEIFY